MVRILWYQLFEINVSFLNYKHLKKVFCTLVIPLLLIVSFKAYAQTNKGTEFWTAYMLHNAGIAGNQASSMVLYIT